MPATNVKTGTVGFPMVLGQLKPGTGFATLSVPLTQNIQPVNIDGTPDNQFNGIFIQAYPGNSLNIFIVGVNPASPIAIIPGAGANGPAPDTTNYTNIIAILTPGSVFVRGKEWANNRDISQIFVGALNATDFAIANVDQF